MRPAGVIVRLAVTGQRDQVEPSSFSASAGGAHQFIAVQVGKPYIDQGQVRLQLQQLLKPRSAVLRVLHSMPSRLEQEAERFARVSVVLDHDDAEGLLRSHGSPDRGPMRSGPDTALV